MGENIIFSFTPNRMDYIKSLRAFYLHQKSTWYVILLFFLGAVLFGVSVIFLGSLQFNYWLFMPLALLFYILGILFINPISVGNKVESNERLRCKTTWDVNDLGVSIMTEFSETKFDWATFGEVLETEEYLLTIYALNKNMFQIIPKRAFPSSSQLSEFKETLEAKIKPIVQAKSINLPTPSNRALIIIIIGIVFSLVICTTVYNLQQALMR